LDILKKEFRLNHLSMSMKNLSLYLICLSFTAAHAQEGYLLPQTGHSGTVTSINYTPDGKFLLTASEDNTIILWDAATLEQLNVFGGHTSAVKWIGTLDDSTSVVSTSEDGTFIVTDYSSGELITAGEMPGGATSSTFIAGDGETFIFVTNEGEIFVVDDPASEPEAAGKLPVDIFTAIDFNRATGLFAVADTSGEVEIIDASELTIISHLNRSSQATIKKLLFSPDGRYLAGIGTNEVISVWDIKSRSIIFSAKSGSGYSEQIKFFNSSKAILYFLDDVKIAGYDLVNKNELFAYKPFGEITTLAIAPDDRAATTAYFDRSIIQWRIPGREILNKFEPAADKVKKISIDSKGNTLLFTTVASSFHIWQKDQPGSRKFLQTWDGLVLSSDISPSGHYFGYGGPDDNIKIFDANDATELKTIGGEKIGFVNAMKWCLNEDFIASESAEHSIVLRNVTTGKSEKTFKGPTSVVTSIAIQPDKGMITAGTILGEIFVWKIDDASLIVKSAEPGAPVISIAFTDNGNKIAAAAENGSIFTINPVTLKVEKSDLHGINGVTAMAVSAKQDFMAVAGELNAINIFGLKDTSFNRSVTVSFGPADWLSFSSDSRYLMASSTDRSVYIIDVDSGNHTGTLTFFAQGEWVLVTPENEFDCPEGGAEHLRFIENNKASVVPAATSKHFKKGLAEKILF